MEDTNVATQDVVETTTAAATDAVKDADEAAVSNAKPNKRRNNDDDVPEEKLMEMFDFSKPIPRVSRVVSCVIYGYHGVSRSCVVKS